MTPKRLWLSQHLTINVIVFIFSFYFLSGLATAESFTQAQDPSNLQREGQASTGNVVAPNIDLKEIAPPPEALLDPNSATKSSLTSRDTLKTPETNKEPNSAATTPTKQPPLAPNLSSVSNSTTEANTTNNTETIEASTSNKDMTSTSQPSDPFVILGAEVPPGVSTRLGWTPGIAIAGLATPVPVLVINGVEPGKTFCLLAAIHGDELNGIEVVRRVIYEIDPKKLKGRIIGVPIVNLQGFQRNSRYLADRRDLNRYFPGVPHGSLASRIAYSLFNEVITHCDAVIDLHTGSLRRNNLPQLRADMTNPLVVKFSEFFDEMVVVHSPGSEGMLRWAASKQNIPAVTLEIGESNRLDESQVKIGVKSINSLLDRMGMYERLFTWGAPEPVYYKSIWVRVEQGGILLSAASLGDIVKKGDILGKVTDPITNEVSNIKAPSTGRIIGMAVNQVVMPGFAAYHLGIKASEKEVMVSANKQKEDAEISEVDNLPE